VFKAYRYRLITTLKQEKKIQEHLSLHRFVYNRMLKQRINIYKKKKVSLNYRKHQQKQLPLLKDNRPELQATYSTSLQETTARLDSAFQNLFNRIKKGEKGGFPRFKNKDRFNSLHYSNGFQINGNKITLSKLGTFKFRKSRDYDGKIKKVILKKSGNNFYISIICEVKANTKITRIKNIVGVDLGINRYATISDGNNIETEKNYEKRLNRLQLNQRRLSKKKLKSNNRFKSKKIVITHHEKVKNSREDFLHKNSTYLIKTYDVLVFEDLNIQKMLKSESGFKQQSKKSKRTLNRNILDMAFGKFINLLTYKAEEAGKFLILINPKNTSKTCSKCHHLNQKDLKNYRIFVCEECGFKADRDYNASLNILYRGLDTVRNTEINACGALAELKDMITDQPKNIVCDFVYAKG